MKRRLIDAITLLVIAVFAIGGFLCIRAYERRNAVTEITIGKYQVTYRARNAGPKSEETTLEQLQANPDVLDITWSDPDPNGSDECDLLWHEWYRGDHWFNGGPRWVHRGTPYRAKNDC